AKGPGRARSRGMGANILRGADGRGRNGRRGCRENCHAAAPFQSKRLDTDSSREVRPIASPIRGAMERTLILRATFTASVGWIESVITSDLSFDEVTRATAPPDSTPWVI